MISSEDAANYENQTQTRSKHLGHERHLLLETTDFMRSFGDFLLLQYRIWSFILRVRWMNTEDSAVCSRLTEELKIRTFEFKMKATSLLMGSFKRNTNGEWPENEFCFCELESLFPVTMTCKFIFLLYQNGPCCRDRQLQSFCLSRRCANIF